MTECGLTAYVNFGKWWCTSHQTGGLLRQCWCQLTAMPDDHPHKLIGTGCGGTGYLPVMEKPCPQVASQKEQELG